MSENTIDKHLKVKSMPSLCFNKDDFVSDEFSVDKFVSECRKYASLNTMRDDLNIFHKMLCSAMIELLNKDYADFVNLSSNLAGLDKSIKSLTVPLESLKNEIYDTKTNLDNTLLSVMKMFNERATIHYSKVLIHHLVIIEEGLDKINLLGAEDNHNFDVEILERIAIVFNNVQFHMQKIVENKNYSLINTKEEVLCIYSIAKNLEQQLQAVFLQSLSPDGLHKQDLNKILRIYSYISEENKVERIFRTSVVRPVMKNLISENNITKFGLGKVLNDVINFIPSTCNDVLKMTRRTNNVSEGFVPGYDFLVNAIWPEIIDAFEYVSPIYLYSLGDPEQFHQNFCLILKFLNEFEQMCGIQSSVTKLRHDSSYKEFIEKFNLDVYFQIRFQEIASSFEINMLEENLVKETNDTKTPYCLKATVALWTCLNLCWCSSIYLAFLRKDFWCLTIQLLFRYNKFIHCCLKNIKEETVELALLIKDIKTLVPELQRFFLDTVRKKLDSEPFHSILEDASEEVVRLLNQIPPVATELIVKILVEKCTSHLKLITSIPQRFRKTNREIPSKPSPYVSLVLTPLTEFSMQAKSILPRETCKYCELKVTDEVMEQCITLMRDVLTSIKKMEDSLKILKKARDKPNQKALNAGEFSTFGAITDDDKIRRQLSIDVTYFEELILKSGLEVSDLKSFKELKGLVTSAEKVSGSSSS